VIPFIVAYGLIALFFTTLFTVGFVLAKSSKEILTSLTLFHYTLSFIIGSFFAHLIFLKTTQPIIPSLSDTFFRFFFILSTKLPFRISEFKLLILTYSVTSFIIVLYLVLLFLVVRYVGERAGIIVKTELTEKIQIYCRHGKRRRGKHA